MLKIDMPCKNILILGNGFDLHHNMKTKYSDYIKFIRDLKNTNANIKKNNKTGVMTLDDLNENNTKLKAQCLQTYKDKGFSEEIIKKVWSTLENNFVQYFMVYDEKVEGWIDFEILIKNITVDLEVILSKIDNIESDAQDNYKSGIIGNRRENLLAKSFNKIFDIDESSRIYIKDDLANVWTGINKKEVIKILRKEFDGLCDSLWIYLKEIEPYCREIKTEYTYQQIESINADAIITFNYTDTYNRYRIKPENIIHVHGSLEEKNIVLGFNDDDEKELQYIYFKKYMQCILKATPILERYNFSTEILDEWGLRTSNYAKPIMHFFGHSLNITDKEKLMHLFTNASRIKIYYYDEDDHEEKIERVIDLLGKSVALPWLYEKFIDFIPIKKTEEERTAEEEERRKPYEILLYDLFKK